MNLEHLLSLFDGGGFKQEDLTLIRQEIAATEERLATETLRLSRLREVERFVVATVKPALEAAAVPAPATARIVPESVASSQGRVQENRLAAARYLFNNQGDAPRTKAALARLCGIPKGSTTKVFDHPWFGSDRAGNITLTEKGRDALRASRQGG
jgi:hypothetical protein